MTANHDRTAGESALVVELRQRVAQISLRAGLQFTTFLAARCAVASRDPRLAEVQPEHVARLAGEFLLWGRIDGGRGMSGEEGRRLLGMVSRLQANCAAEAAAACDSAGHAATPPGVAANGDDPFAASASCQVARPGAIGDRLGQLSAAEARTARTWMMVHELAREGGLEISDLGGETRRLLGASADDLWLVGFLAYDFHLRQTAEDKRRWAFQLDELVPEGPHRQEVLALLHRVVRSMALTPAAFRKRYGGASSVAGPGSNGGAFGRDRAALEHWDIEAKPLRHFPLVDLGDGMFAAPAPPQALLRASDALLRDLPTEEERRYSTSTATDAYARDNLAARTLDALTRRYLWRQLRLLAAPGEQLRGPFEYGPPEARRQSPDWVLARDGRTPLLLHAASYRSAAEDATAVCRRFAEFVRGLDAQLPGLESFDRRLRCLGIIVLPMGQASHDLWLSWRRGLRRTGATASNACVLDGRRCALDERLVCVPLSLCELEAGIAVELNLGLALETQLLAWLHALENRPEACTAEADGAMAVGRFAEFLAARHAPAHLTNPLCAEGWQRFCHICGRRLLGERAADDDRSLSELIERLAYALWEQRGRPAGDSQRDWLDAEAMILSGTARYLGF